MKSRSRSKSISKNIPESVFKSIKNSISKSITKNKTKIIKYDPSIVIAYTDGSLSYVKTGNMTETLCGYGIYFPANEYKSVSRRFVHAPITNNRAELYAIYKTIVLCFKIDEKRIKSKEERVKKLIIYSDSEYCVKTYNTWLSKWIVNGKKFLNTDIIMQTHELITKAPFRIEFVHIRAHTGNKDVHSVNNDMADQLAKNGAKRLY